MVSKKTFDIITTVLLALIPVIVFFQEVIVLYVPLQYLVVANLVLAFLSQYAANQRVKNAVEEIRTYKIIDYITTFLFAVGPIILAFQSIILGNIPLIYIPIATLLFGALSQFVTNKRVQASREPGIVNLSSG